MSASFPSLSLLLSESATDDLHDRYSCVGIQRSGRVEIITNDQGNRITPSYVGFVDDERLIGDAAKNQAAQNPENTM